MWLFVAVSTYTGGWSHFVSCAVGSVNFLHVRSWMEQFFFPFLLYIELLKEGCH